MKSTIVLSLLLFVSFNIYSQDDVEKRVTDLLSKMTLKEKIGQMAQYHLWSKGGEDNIKDDIKKGLVGSLLNAGDLKTKNDLQKIAVEESRLGIPLIYGRDVIHGYRTMFPIPLGQAASWNPALVQEAARIAAVEASSEGIKWTFAPMIDNARDPRWGRIAESCGEDVYLASKLAASMVKGFQGENLSDAESIAACAKHYVGYGAAEGGRDYNTTYIPEQLLREIYLPPFKSAVDAGVATLMSAFNDINGIPASGNDFTLNKVLRGEWNFDGFVVSDWSSVTEMITHGYAKDEYEAAMKSANAGVDMEMVSLSYADNLEKLIQDGLVSEEVVNTAAGNILRIKFRCGLFENPYTKEPKVSKLLTENHLAAAKQLAEQSIVMLKNNTVLPLSKKVKTIAVFGPLADSPEDQMGTWSPDGKKENTQTPLTSLKKSLEGIAEIKYLDVLENSRTIDKSKFEDAVKLAELSDVILLFLGEEAILSGEAHSRAFLNLPGAQDDLFETLSHAGKPIVVVIMAGRPLTFPNISERADAILYAWHPGTMGGPAIADILVGLTSPSGKLPVTFPRTVGQIPIYYSHKNTGRPPSENMLGIPIGTPLDPKGFVSNYLDVDFTPAYPFGYGLSYTKFEYSNLQMFPNEVKNKSSFSVSFDLNNIGDYEATEVVQLYVRDLYASVTRPVKELKRFERVTLKPGDKKTILFQLSTDDLSFINNEMLRVTEPGEFKLWVGGDSDCGLGTSFFITE
ncbi:MAG: beta-glucosidase BglX [Bacteroidetes bacterium]|nr:beta-glucosidase BglX [Bacteroidota bacterium]